MIQSTKITVNGVENHKIVTTKKFGERTNWFPENMEDLLHDYLRES